MNINPARELADDAAIEGGASTWKQDEIEEIAELHEDLATALGNARAIAQEIRQALSTANVERETYEQAYGSVKCADEALQYALGRILD